jgi:hypothetical protein
MTIFRINEIIFEKLIGMLVQTIFSGTFLAEIVNIHAKLSIHDSAISLTLTFETLNLSRFIDHSSICISM